MEWKTTPDRKSLTWGGLDRSKGGRLEVLSRSMKRTGGMGLNTTGTHPAADQTSTQQKPRFVTGCVLSLHLLLNLYLYPESACCQAQPRPGSSFWMRDPGYSS